MEERTDRNYTSSGAARRRPGRRVVQQNSDEVTPTLLTEDFIGLAVAYGNTLLFIGFEVNGLVEIAVYPRYRFSSDDRVQGHLGYVRVPLGTSWEEIIPQVDDLFELAQNNYRTAVTLRANAARAHGARFDTAYDAITDVFRESWHGFKLRLIREGSFQKSGMTFTGTPPGPVLVVWRGDQYTLQVFPTGSILLVTGDQRRRLNDLAQES
jgi:hypothetical protein